MESSSPKPCVVTRGKHKTIHQPRLRRALGDKNKTLLYSFCIVSILRPFPGSQARSLIGSVFDFREAES